MDLAVGAAREAFDDPSWRDMTAMDRRNLLLRLADLVQEHAPTLATIETWDNGKPYQVALTEDVVDVVNTLRYYAGWADKLSGPTIDAHPHKLAYTVREPYGVCGQIIPWNYPLALATWKLAPALACGNTVVMKPAEQTPLSILYLASLIRVAGFPAGVVNIVNGAGQTAGQRLASHAGIDKLSFTGSTTTACEVMRGAAVNMTDVMLETGGKSAAIVWDDADLAQAIRWTHAGIMSNAGQICSATSRVLVHESIRDRFLQALIEYTHRTSILGDPFDPRTTHGPLISRAQYDRVKGFIQTGVREGGRLVMGGCGGDDGDDDDGPFNIPSQGYYLPPTLLIQPDNNRSNNNNDDNNDKMMTTIWHQEIFGPVLILATFSTEQEAIHLANSSTYGLAAAVFTTDLVRAHRLARRIRVGSVWLNSSNDPSDCRIPSTGLRKSDAGGADLAHEAITAWSCLKAVHVNLSS